MKYLLLLFSALLISTASFAQKSKPQPIKDGDPLIGTWVASGEDGGAPIIEEEISSGVIVLGTGDGSCMLGMYMDPEQGIACPMYFTAMNDGKSISGKIDSGCMPDYEGKAFSFVYSYDKATDQRIVTVGDYKHTYNRDKDFGK